MMVDMERRVLPLRDRVEAGRRLAGMLRAHWMDRPIVLGIPRGGVVVAAEVARGLDAPLDVLVARKVGAPRNPELGLGAVAEGGIRHFDAEATARLGVRTAQVRATLRRENRELLRRVGLYRADRLPLSLTGRTAILVDDGAATGGTFLAAIESVRGHDPAHVLGALGVASAAAARDIRAHVDELDVVLTPEELMAVSQWYRHFETVTDSVVLRLLEESRHRFPVPSAPSAIPREPLVAPT